jgi:hypothetical protein
MKIQVAILFVFCLFSLLLSPTKGQESLLSSSDLDELIAAVNNIRVNTNPFGNLPPLVRNDNLTAAALEWANTCTFGSSPKNRLLYSELTAYSKEGYLNITEVRTIENKYCSMTYLSFLLLLFRSLTLGPMKSIM